MTISIEPGDLPQVTRVLKESWGGTTVVALGRGETVDAAALPGFVALDGIPIRRELELELPLSPG
ncbi:hypothetical protein [Nonomuraea sediminis]|uniref:hypothetical protein n=1 Tax=Nonomuraea sediminis TaxID=2835864 RepID=UPI001BDDC47B|nr:hypothetical protein [Nonomuraea sediminis]